MQTGNISFCGKNALNIKSDVIKKYILNELQSKYNIKILTRHFENFKDDISVQKMTKSPYMVCLKSNGNPYLMFLTKLNNINTCIMIDKKIQQGYFLPRMIIIHTMFDDKLFENTLLEGEMVLDKNNSWLFLINDINVYCSKHLIDTNLIKRYNIIYNMLQNEYIPDNRYFSIQVKKLFKCHEISYVNTTFMNSLPYSSRGVLFKPLFFKFKDILLNFDSSLIKDCIKHKIGTTNEFIESVSIEKQIFNIKHTQTPDVYNLFNKTNGEYVGIACVNSLSVSKFLANLFKNANLQDMFKVECTYNKKFNKWTPIQVC